MAGVQFFWQLYISSVAAKAGGQEDENDIEVSFRNLDADNSGTIDINELEKELTKRGISFSQSDLKTIMKEIDTSGDGLISLEEFKMGIRSERIKKTALW